MNANEKKIIKILMTWKPNRRNQISPLKLIFHSKRKKKNSRDIAMLNNFSFSDFPH